MPPAVDLCPKCGSPIRAPTAAGVCPRCLLARAIDVAPDPGAGTRRKREELPQLETQRSGAAGNATPGLGFIGKYELIARVAEGGMGTVYRARQPGVDRLVALKVIKSGFLAGENERRRFRVEAEAAARLDHPNIVPIYEIGEHAGHPFFTMPLLTGGTLAEQLARHPEPMDATDAARLLIKLARAVDYAHQRGVLHRDLKPSNVLLDDRNEPHVADFGLAKRLPSADAGQPDGGADLDPDPGGPALTLSMAVLGTPNYMSPEQASGSSRSVTTAADVYSLGAMLYEFLTREPPFVAGTPWETIRLVIEREPVPPSRRLRERRTAARSGNTADVAAPAGASSRRGPLRAGVCVDRDLETICLKCLAKDPSRRYPTAAALADDLDRWLRGEPVLARAAGVPERVYKWVRRRPSTAALVALLALLGLAGGGRIAWQYERLTREAEAARRKLWQREQDRLRCHDNLRALFAATQAFRQTSNRWPDSLVELVPAFIADTNRLICPLALLGTPLAETFESSPSSYISYVYEFSPELARSGWVNYDDVSLWRRGMTIRDLRQAQIGRYGAIVPLIRCGHHFPCPSVAHNGEVFETWVAWAYEVAGRANADHRLPPGWFVQGKPVGSHRVSLDFDAPHRGQAAVRLDLDRTAGVNDPRVLLMQILNAAECRDRWLRVSAWIAADSVFSASIFVQLRDRNNLPLPVKNRQPAAGVRASARWKEYEVTTYVPAEAESLAFGVDLSGYGRLWVDDFSFYLDGQPVAVRTNHDPVDPPRHSTAPANLDFELLPAGLVRPSALASGSAPAAGPVTPPGWQTELDANRSPAARDAEQFFQGRASVRLEPRDGRGGGTRLHQHLNAEPFLNQRLSLTAWMRAGGRPEEGAIRLLAYDKQSQIIAQGQSQPVRTEGGIVTSANGWYQVQLELEVPVTARAVDVVGQLSGASTGPVWIDDIRLSILRDGVKSPIVDGGLKNPDFEE